MKNKLFNYCPADINGDGIVDITDLLEVIDNWGSTDGGSADVNNDGLVDVSDLLLVIESLGECGSVSGWSEIKTIIDDGGPSARFGSRVAIVFDGIYSIIAVGAPLASSPDNPQQQGVGAVYIYKVNDDGEVELVQKILGEQLNPYDYPQFGSGLDLFKADHTSAVLNDDRMIIGAEMDQEASSHAGAAYIYKKVNEIWVKETKLLPWGSIAFPHRFGFDVSIVDGYAFVGAHGDDGGWGMASGAVYVFKFENEEWIQWQKLKQLSTTEYDWFGFSVSSYNNLLVVGAPYDDRLPDGSVEAQGSATVFELSDNGYWNVVNPELFLIPGAENDMFGYDVSALDGSVAIAAPGINNDNGSSGAVYIYERQGNGEWSMTSEITDLYGQVGHKFGVSVDVHGEHMLIGAKIEDDKEGDRGFVYLYNRNSAGVWIFSEKFETELGHPGDGFGSIVGVANDVVVIGAKYDYAQNKSIGSIYTYVNQKKKRNNTVDDFDSWEDAWLKMRTKDSGAADLILKELRNRFDFFDASSFFLDEGSFAKSAPSGIVEYRSDGFFYGRTSNDSINVELKVNDKLRILNSSGGMLPVVVGTKGSDEFPSDLFVDFYNGSIRINGVNTNTLSLIKGKNYRLHIPSIKSGITFVKTKESQYSINGYLERDIFNAASSDGYSSLTVKTSEILEKVLYLYFKSYNEYLKVKLLEDDSGENSSNLNSYFKNAMRAYTFQLSDGNMWNFKSKNSVPISVVQKSNIARRWKRGSNYAYNIFGLFQPDLYLVNGEYYDFALSSDDYYMNFTSNSIGGKIEKYIPIGDMESVEPRSEDVIVEYNDRYFASTLRGKSKILAPRYVYFSERGDIRFKIKVFFDNSSPIVLKWDSEHELFNGKQTDDVPRGILKIGSTYNPKLTKEQKYKNVLIKEIIIKPNKGSKNFDIRLMSDDADIIHDRIRVVTSSVDGKNLDVQIGVGSDGPKFKINGRLNPELKFINGCRYTFSQDGENKYKKNNIGPFHPLYLTLSNSMIKDGGTPMSKGVIINAGVRIKRVLTLKLTPGENDFSNIKYACEEHGFGVGNKIIIMDEINLGEDPYWTEALKERVNIQDQILFGGDQRISYIPRERDGSHIYYQSIKDKYMGGKINFTSSSTGYDISKFQSQEGIGPSEYIDLRFRGPGRYIILNSDFHSVGMFFSINVVESKSQTGGDFNELAYDQDFEFKYPFDVISNHKEVEKVVGDISFEVSAEGVDYGDNYGFIRGLISSFGSDFSFSNIIKSSDISQISSQGLGSTLGNINISKRYSIGKNAITVRSLAEDELFLMWNSWSVSSVYLDKEKFNGKYSDKTIDYVNYLNKVRDSVLDLSSDGDFDMISKLYLNDSERVLSRMKVDLLRDTESRLMSFCNIININFGLEVDTVEVLDEILENSLALGLSNSIVLDIHDNNFMSINDSSFMSFISNLEFTIQSINKYIGRNIDVVQFNINNIIKSGKYTPLDISSLIIKLKNQNIGRYIFKMTLGDLSYYEKFYNFINNVRMGVLQTYFSAISGGRSGLTLLADGKSTAIENVDSRELRVIEFCRMSSPRENKLSNWWVSDNSVDILFNKMNNIIKSGVRRIFLRHPVGVGRDRGLNFDQISEMDIDKKNDFLRATLSASSLVSGVEIGLFVGTSDLIDYYDESVGWDTDGLRGYLTEICSIYIDSGISSVAIKMDVINDSNVIFLEEAFELFRTIIIEHSIRVYFYGFYLNSSKMFGSLLMKYPTIVDEDMIGAHYSELNVDLKNVEWHILK